MELFGLIEVLLYTEKTGVGLSAVTAGSGIQGKLEVIWPHGVA
jgi:hypothetical protein